MAAAALRTRGPGRADQRARAHCALGRGSAVLGRRRRRPGDMAGAEVAAAAARAPGGEARPLGSHRGGEERRGEEGGGQPGSAWVT